MQSRPATMANASRAGAMPLLLALPEEIVVWEILVRLPPKSLLRCRAVCRAWRCATSTCEFLQAHRRRQPSLPIVYGSEYSGACCGNLRAFCHRAAAYQLQPVVRLQHSFFPKASCDGLLILSSHELSAHQIPFYVFALGSNEPPRYIEGPEVAASTSFHKPALLRDSLHWYPVHYRNSPKQCPARSKVVIIFDTTFETFRQMRAPVVPAKSYIFDIDGTLGIYSYDETTQIVGIRMLRDYESEVWEYRYSVKLPAAKIRSHVGWLKENWHVSVHSVDGDILLLVRHGGWVFYVDVDGKLVDNFHRDGHYVYACKLQLKQTLVPHNFFTALQGYAVNALPFV